MSVGTETMGIKVVLSGNHCYLFRRCIDVKINCYLKLKNVIPLGG